MLYTLETKKIMAYNNLIFYKNNYKEFIKTLAGMSNSEFRSFKNKIYKELPKYCKILGTKLNWKIEKVPIKYDIVYGNPIEFRINIKYIRHFPECNYTRTYIYDLQTGKMEYNSYNELSKERTRFIIWSISKELNKLYD